jgi:osmotically-inducible protein OsmY
MSAKVFVTASEELLVKPLALLILGICLFGCAPPEDQRASETNATTKPDNTIVNRRDQDGDTATPLDQNENSADVDLTAKIRQQVVDANLSLNAQNIKIITQNGRVTLRGPVQSEDEKTKIGELAAALAGAGNVDNQLEIKQ